MWLDFYPVDRPGLVHVLDMIKRLMDGLCMCTGTRLVLFEIWSMRLKTQSPRTTCTTPAPPSRSSHTHLYLIPALVIHVLFDRVKAQWHRQTGNSPSFLSLPPGATVGIGGLAKEARDMAALAIWEPQPCTAPAVQFRQPREHSPPRPSMHMASVQPSPRPRRELEVRGALRSE